MLKLINILIVMASLVACNKTEENNKTDVVFAVEPASLSFSAEGGTQELTVRCKDNPYVTPWDNWLSCTKGAMADNSIKISVKAEANNTDSKRKSTISVSHADEIIRVEVEQEAGENQGGNGGTSSTEPVRTDNLAWAISDKLGIGWNLGNHMDAYNNGVSSETAWGNPKATQATFDGLKKVGFSTVRIPVTWLGHIGEAPDYKIDEAWLERVAELVGYAEKAGLNAIVNIHHDGSESKYWLNITQAAINAETQKQILAQITAMWTQIAEKFKDKGDFLIFEAFNEIHDGKWGWGENRKDGGKQYHCLNEWNAAFVRAVRSTGGKNAERLLGVPAYCTNVDICIDSFVMPDDTAKDKLMISVHCYDPSEYCLTAKYNEWGHTAANNKKVPGDNEEDLKKVFEKIYTHYISKGIPVYLGEFGCVMRADARSQSFQQYYLKYYGALARIYGVPSIIWDNGSKNTGNECHGFINHGTGAYSNSSAQKAIEALIKGYTDKNLTLKAIYNQAP